MWAGLCVLYAVLSAPSNFPASRVVTIVVSFLCRNKQVFVDEIQVFRDPLLSQNSSNVLCSTAYSVLRTIGSSSPQSSPPLPTPIPLPLSSQRYSCFPPPPLSPLRFLSSSHAQTPHMQFGRYYSCDNAHDSAVCIVPSDDPYGVCR